MGGGLLNVSVACFSQRALRPRITYGGGGTQHVRQTGPTISQACCGAKAHGSAVVALPLPQTKPRPSIILRPWPQAKPRQMYGPHMLLPYTLAMALAINAPREAIGCRRHLRGGGGESER